MNLKLGRKYPTRAKLQLHKYIGGSKLPPLQASTDWTLAMTGDWGAMRNAGPGALGDCTMAGMGHAVQVISSNGDGLITPSDHEIVKAYEVVGGYNPNDPNTDQGATELAAMRFMVDHGLAGVRVDAFADVDNTNLDQVKYCIQLFGGCYIGVQITQEDMDDADANRAWQDLNMDHIVGGHALWVPAYDANGITVITWGIVKPASWEWFRMKCDEAHVCIFFPWVVNSMNVSPDGFDKAQLEADLKAL